MNECKSRYKVVIYDCDGVMLDSIESNYIFYDQIMSHLGRPPLDRSDIKSRTVLHTYSFINVMNYFFQNDPQAEQAMAFARTIHYSDLVQYMRMEEGFVETLNHIRGHASLAICTNRANSMEKIIEDFGLTGYFTCVMTAAKVTFPKPHPEPLLKVLEHYGVEPHQALFIGDAEVDRQSAEGAGIPFIAYKTNVPAMARIDHHREALEHIFELV